MVKIIKNVEVVDGDKLKITETEVKVEFIEKDQLIQEKLDLQERITQIDNLLAKFEK